MDQLVANNTQKNNGFFTETLSQTDPDILMALSGELSRQQQQVELIASENIVSAAVLEAQGSVLTNKYAEGYPGRRYYGGCEEVDKAEALAIERAKALFECNYANVQPSSGSQANQAIFMALMQPGDTFMGMSLDGGGHLTHGAKPNQSGKWFNPVHYGIRADNHLIDYDEMEQLTKTHKPKLIIAGGSAYSRIIDFARVREIADSVGAYMMVDMAHFAGLVAGRCYPNPLKYADVVTSTTHKTLRGPRGGIALTNDRDIAKKINSAVFPGLQGGPLMHAVAAKAVAFGEALRPEFKTYAENVVNNARSMAKAIQSAGLDVVSGGTDSHLLLIDLRPKNVTGVAAEQALENAFITCNKNSVPDDPQKPMITSGLRVGSPAGTTRGFGAEEFTQIGKWIGEIVEALSQSDNIADTENRVRDQVMALTDRFPIYINRES